MLHDSALITQVQQKLSAAGVYAGPTDGKTSPELAAAIKEFQAKQGIDQSGAIDHKTADALGLDWSKFHSGSTATGESKTMGETIRGAASDVEKGLKQGASEAESGANKAAGEIKDTAKDAEKKLEEQTK